MKPRSGSASEFVLRTLRQYSDRELRVADLVDLAGGKFKHDNIVFSLRVLRSEGQVTRIKEGNDAWWAVVLS